MPRGCHVIRIGSEQDLADVHRQAGDLRGDHGRAWCAPQAGFDERALQPMAETLSIGARTIRLPVMWATNSPWKRGIRCRQRFRPARRR
jgi:hypothetical protein